MDYAFVPGETVHELNLKEFYKRRPNTILVEEVAGKAIVRVDEFLNYLKVEATIIKPIENIIIAAHGNDSGYMGITFADIRFNNSTSPDSYTIYETLEVADNSKINNIDPSLIDANTKLHIKGCDIGQSTPFVQKMKACFGGIVLVSAPKYSHTMYPITELGILEYFSYDFTIVTRNYFKGKNARRDLIKALQVANFKFLDGVTKIPNTLWTTWLPRAVSEGDRVVGFPVNFLPILIDDTGTNLTSYKMDILGAFSAYTDPYEYIIPYASGNAPKNLATQKNDLLSNLNSDPRFSATHPLPTYARYHYNSIAEFIAGFNWKFSLQNNNKELNCYGTRIIYSLAPPITNNPLGANTLICNVSPNSGNTSPTTPQIVETDTRLFLTV